jgi:cytochrome oxidase Cu insertion factor (SCO1/SenC/PrrC family)
VRRRDDVRRREFIGLAATGIVAGFTGFASAAPPSVGKMAPEFSVTLTDGRMVSLRDFRGNPVVVNFWSSG